jgi:magnesium chelatase accessory protein
MPTPSTLDFERDGRDWPLREHCRFVEAGELRWLVLDMGQGPPLLLLHGTGAATHSWRGLAPILARRFRVIAPDLPGHGFTDTPEASGRTLPSVAKAVGELLRVLGVSPAFAVGHSAGAAILVRMALDGWIAPAGIVSLNGAFIGFRGPLGQLFSPLAKLLVLNPFVPAVFAWRASDGAMVERLLSETGSRLDPDGVEFYRRLVRNPGHVAGALGMMAAWDLRPLERDLPALRVPLFLVAASRDRTVSPEQAREVRSRVRSAELIRLDGLGHLAHEEDPERVAGLVTELAERVGVLPPPAEARPPAPRKPGRRPPPSGD